MRENNLLRAVGCVGATWLFALLCGSTDLAGQETSDSSDGSTWAAVGGAALGAYSGTVLGAVGSLMPCTRTYEGPACVRPAAIGGGLIGGLSGAALGAVDASRVGDAFVAGVIGATVGGAALLAVQPFLERWSWGDVGAGAVIGGAVAASGPGAAIGFGAGAIVGGATWQLVPSVKLPDAVAVTLFGLAAGGIGGWVWRAIDAKENQNESAGAQPAVLGFTIRTN